MSNMQQGVDIVLTWVDDRDPEWQAERAKYMPAEEKGRTDQSAARYRDWDNLKYVFRGIEKYMPWVRKVHFITCGHLPKWLNTECDKLNIVKHSDYIPAEYLPTFSSRVIELWMNRIEGLSEDFILFNDDTFVIKMTKREDFFDGDLPRDIAALSPHPIRRNTITSTEINNLKILNDYFGIKDIKARKKLWIKPFMYGQYALRTLMFMKFPTIIGLFEAHLPVSYNKSTFDKVWELEGAELLKTSGHRFRTDQDNNHWLMRSWQLLGGNFSPRSPRFGKLIPAQNIEMLKHFVSDRKCKLVCINDNDNVTDFEKTKAEVNGILDSILPEKSSFERDME